MRQLLESQTQYILNDYLSTTVTNEDNSVIDEIKPY